MGESLKSKTLKGVIWSAAEQFSVLGVAFGLGILVARMLSPEAYGIVGMVTVVFTIAKVFVDSGFSNALIRKNDRTEVDYCTVFYFNAFIGLMASLIIFFSAPLIADFYEMPDLRSIVQVLCWGVFISSLGAVQSVHLTIALDFKTKMKISLFCTLISGSMGLVCAYLGWGVWALVTQMLAGSTLNLIAVWAVVRWVPRRAFSMQSFKTMFAYGSRLLASSLLDVLNSNIVTIVVGKYLSAATLGTYTRARNFASFPSQNINGIIQRVTFPVLSKLQDEDKRLESAYRRLLKVTSFVVFPMMMGLAALAEPLILALLGDKWADSIPLLQLMCFSMMWYPVHSLNLNLLQVKGRSDLFLRLEVIKKVLGISVLCIALPMGIIALCQASIVTTLICWAINSYYTGKLINIGFFVQIIDLLPIVFCSMLMGACVWFIAGCIELHWLQLLLGTLSGVLIYLLIAVLCRLDSLKHLIDLVKGR